jgi:hypothetical protein
MLIHFRTVLGIRDFLPDPYLSYLDLGDPKHTDPTTTDQDADSENWYLHLHHSSKIKSHKEVTKKTAEIRFFLLFLLDDGRIRIRTSDKRIRMRIREAKRQTDPTDPDPDPQHCLQRGASRKELIELGDRRV